MSEAAVPAVAPGDETALTSTPPPDSQVPEKGGSQIRNYVLLKQVQPDVFQRVAIVSAGTPESALKTLGQEALLAAEHVAVTERSWFAPGKPKIKTNTVISFE